MSERLVNVNVGGVALHFVVHTDHDDKGGWWATSEGLPLKQGKPQPAAFAVSEDAAIDKLKVNVRDSLLAGVIETIQGEGSRN